MNKNIISIAIIIVCANSIYAMEDSQLNDLNRSTMSPDWKVVSIESAIESGNFSSPTKASQLKVFPEIARDGGYLGAVLDASPTTNNKSLEYIKAKYGIWNNEIAQKKISRTEYDEQLIALTMECIETGVLVGAFEKFKKLEEMTISINQRPVLYDLYQIYLRKQLSDYTERKAVVPKDFDGLKSLFIDEELSKELADYNSSFFGPLKDKIRFETAQHLMNEEFSEVPFEDTEKQKAFNKVINDKIQQVTRARTAILLGVSLFGFACGSVVTKILLTKKST